MSNACKPIRVGVTGTRYGISEQQYLLAQGWLDKPFWGRNYEMIEFHHGDCVGADIQLATMVRASHPNCKIICHPPTKEDLRGFFESDETLPAKSYFARNRDIVDSCDMLIAFPIHEDRNKGGTWYTINYAHKKKRKCGIFFYDGHREMI